MAQFNSRSAVIRPEWAIAIASRAGTGRQGLSMHSRYGNPKQSRSRGGADNIGMYNKTSKSYRKWCKTCGGHIFTEHPGMGLTDVYAAVIPDLPYQAGIHVNYQETRLRIKDGLPKLKDLPKELGGSGIVVAE